MKYNICINQKAIIDNNWDLKANHIAVLEVIKEFILSGESKSIIDNNFQWFWVSYELIISELPMFEIGKDRCRQLIKDLSSYGLLDIYENNQNVCKTYYKIGSNYKKMMFFEKDTYEKNSIGIPKNPEINSIPPMEKIQDNNNTIYNINNINKVNELNKKLISKDRKPDSDFFDIELPPNTLELSYMKFVKATGNKDCTKKDILDFWEIFKKQHFNGHNFYDRITQIYNHFTNWIPNQKIAKKILKNESNITNFGKNNKGSQIGKVFIPD